MKRIAYQNFGRGESFVDYEIFDGHECVFSGVNSDGTSTINAAEQIIRAIAEAEKKSFKFYDLQTRRGYGRFMPGHYFFSALVVTNQDNPEVVRWVPQSPSREVLEAFKGHIGPNPDFQVRK